MTHNGSSPIKVLYVEDEKEIQFVVAEMLSVLGYKTACADNGKLGLEKARSWQPDLILTDFCMPVMNGLEAIRELRSNPDTAQIPIFVLSASIDRKTREVCRNAGADKFFDKPFDIDEINSAIQERLKL